VTAEIATSFETSQTDTHGIGSARSLRLKNSSRKKPSQYRDTALMRHTFRNVCTEANFGARIRYSDNVSGPLPTEELSIPVDQDLLRGFLLRRFIGAFDELPFSNLAAARTSATRGRGLDHLVGHSDSGCA
jgi:hypothetical protein